jgi:hypothetical protein
MKSTATAHSQKWLCHDWRRRVSITIPVRWNLARAAILRRVAGEVERLADG